jgi:hypothetical protein
MVLVNTMSTDYWALENVFRKVPPLRLSILKTAVLAIAAIQDLYSLSLFQFSQQINNTKTMNI